TYPHCDPPCTAAARCGRHAALDQAAAELDELTGTYPWTPSPADPGYAPTSFEPPHALLERAQVEVLAANPRDPAAVATAQGSAQTFLRRMRETYPAFRLHGKSAITGFARGSASVAPVLPDDELNWYHERLLDRPVIAAGGIAQ